MDWCSTGVILSLTTSPVLLSKKRSNLLSKTDPSLLLFPLPMNSLLPEPWLPSSLFPKPEAISSISWPSDKSYSLNITIYSQMFSPFWLKTLREHLLQQLLLIEFNDVIAHAEAKRPDWILHSLQPDGWLDLTEEVLFQAGNCALLGLLTLILTLPWELELKILLEKDVASQPS